MAQKVQVTEGQRYSHGKDVRELPDGETDQERVYRLLWHGSLSRSVTQLAPSYLIGGVTGGATLPHAYAANRRRTAACRAVCKTFHTADALRLKLRLTPRFRC